MKRVAFTIIESLVYLGMLSIFVCGVFSYVITTQNYLEGQTNGYAKFIRKTLALNVLKQDLMSFGSFLESRSMSDNVSFVKNFSSYSSLLQTAHIEWDIVKDGLRRSFQPYDQNSKKWLSTHSTLFPCDIKKLSLKTYQTNNVITHVDVLYQTKDNRQESMTVALRNRILL